MNDYIKLYGKIAQKKAMKKKQQRQRYQQNLEKKKLKVTDKKCKVCNIINVSIHRAIATCCCCCYCCNNFIFFLYYTMTKAYFSLPEYTHILLLECKSEGWNFEK